MKKFRRVLAVVFLMILLLTGCMRRIGQLNKPFGGWKWSRACRMVQWWRFHRILFERKLPGGSSHEGSTVDLSFRKVYH